MKGKYTVEAIEGLYEILDQEGIVVALAGSELSADVKRASLQSAYDLGYEQGLKDGEKDIQNSTRLKDN